MDDNIRYLIKDDTTYYTVTSSYSLSQLSSEDFSQGCTAEQLQNIDVSDNMYLSLENPVVVAKDLDTGTVTELPSGCGTTCTTDDTNIDLHGYSGIESIAINSDSVGGRYIISFDQRATWYTRDSSNAWVTIDPANIYTLGMDIDTINALTKADYAPIFQRTQLDMMIAVGYLPDTDYESYCTGFTVNLPENQAPVIKNLAVNHSSIHNGKIELTADIEDLEGNVVQYRIESTHKSNLINQAVGDFQLSSKDYYTNDLDDDYCLYLGIDKDEENSSLPCSKTSEIEIEVADTSVLTLWHKQTYSSSSNLFRIYIDGTQAYSQGGTLTDWTEFTYNLTAGAHTVKFEYYKAVSTASDALGTMDETFIDCVTVDTLPIVDKTIELCAYTTLPASNSISFNFPSTNLAAGKNNITVYAKDSKGLESSASIVVTVVDTSPYITLLSIEGARLTMSILDTEGDKVDYKMSLNGTLIKDYSVFSDSPMNVDTLIGSTKMVIGQLNTLVIQLKDEVNMESLPFKLEFVGQYTGLLFRDASGDYYSTSTGEVLKKLQFDPMFAGQICPPKSVYLENNTGYAVTNVELSTLPEVVTGIYPQIAFNDNFTDMANPLVIPSMAQGDVRKFYVRVKTDKNAAGTTDFDINVESDIS